MTGSHIDTGLLGLLGFPVVGIVYGLYRSPAIDAREAEMRDLRLRVKRLEQRLTKIQAMSEES